MLTELNEKNFDSVIASSKLSIVDFWAQWCAPCRHMMPILEEASEELRGSVNFYKLNIDEHTLIASRFQVMSIPTLILFVEGKEQDRHLGGLPKKVLIEWIQKFTPAR